MAETRAKPRRRPSTGELVGRTAILLILLAATIMMVVALRPDPTTGTRPNSSIRLGMLGVLLILVLADVGCVVGLWQSIRDRLSPRREA
jgi:hypothetical protein